jgi:hypothetical protein
MSARDTLAALQCFVAQFTSLLQVLQKGATPCPPPISRGTRPRPEAPALPNALVSDPLRVGLARADQWRQALAQIGGGCFIKPWSTLPA